MYSIIIISLGEGKGCCIGIFSRWVGWMSLGRGTMSFALHLNGHLSLYIQYRVTGTQGAPQ